MILTRPPTNTKADTIANKGWLNDVYRELSSGLLVPGGGNPFSPIYSGRRNLLVNGDMMINQRQGTWSAPWTLDRWAATNTGNNIFVNPNSPKNFTNPLVGFNELVDFDCAVGNAVASVLNFGQAVESVKIQEISGLPVTLSFWVFGGSAFSTSIWTPISVNQETGSIIAIARTGTGINEGTLQPYTGSKDILTIAATPLPTFWTFYQSHGIIPTNANELQVIFTATKSTIAYPANGFFAITGVQLEVGTQPTAFDKISFAQSLAECQRFYQKSFVYSQAPVQNCGSYVGTVSGECVVSGVVNYVQTYNYKVPMAKIPNATFFNPVAANANWRNTARGLDSGTGFIANPGDSGCGVVCTQIAGDGVGNTLAVHMTLDANF